MEKIARVKWVLKKKRFWLGLIMVGFLLWWSGFLTGWWLTQGKMGKFPAVDSSTRLLIVSPHPDDETLMAGGLIQQVIASGGQVEVVWLTNGDASKFTVAWQNRRADFNPQEFLALGEMRIGEASQAANTLGLGEEGRIFLGFPDQGLEKLLHRYMDKLDGLGSSPTTRMDHVPYVQAFRPGQEYLGMNLVRDLKDVVDQFKPTLVVTTHPSDNHPDHKAAFEAIDRVRQTGTDFPIYAAVIHYRSYPNPTGDYLAPPKKLFNKDWVSFELTDAERQIKGTAESQYKSQVSNSTDRNFFKEFDARNEIFELE